MHKDLGFNETCLDAFVFRSLPLLCPKRRGSKSEEEEEEEAKKKQSVNLFEGFFFGL